MKHIIGLAVAVSALALFGCQVQNTKEPSPPVTVKPNFADGTEFTISEVCYQGQVYIVTSKGGITPKLVSFGTTLTIPSCKETS